MAAPSRASTWLQKVRSSVENSQEWEHFTERLFDAVQQQMAESVVGSVRDLSETERAFVLQKATKAVQGGDSYQALMSMVSTCLEEEIYRQIAQEMQDGELVKNTTGLLRAHLKDGVIALLEESPDLRGRLRLLFNQPLPADLRRLTWRLHLANAKARLEYLSQLAANRATSLKDREISLRCQALLDSELTFRALRNRKAAERCLRNVLSYYHKLQDTPAPLRDQDYFLAVPLLHVVTEDPAAPQTSVNSISALLVEEFLTLMKRKPWLARCFALQDPTCASIMQETVCLLEQIDRDVARFLESIYMRAEGDSKDTLLRGLGHMLQPVFSTLFTGYLSMEAVLYIWDQIILGFEHPAYNCLSAFAAIFVVLLRDQLLQCRSPAELEAALKTQGPALSVQAFQNMVGEHCFEKLYRQLLRDGHEPFPIHDPTQEFPPWSYRKHQTAALPRTRPEDRKRMREERDLLQWQRMERTEQEQRLQRFREEEQKRQQESRFLQLLEETKRQFEMQKVRLEEQLSQERQLRYETQSKAQQQIGGLRAEMSRLRERKTSSPDAYSAGSLLAPAPSPQTRTPSQTSQTLVPLAEKAVDNRHQASNRRHERAQNLTLQLLEKLMEAATAMANGPNTEEREHLDAATVDNLRDYVQDCKNAKIEMFGYEANEEEIEDLPEPSRKEVRKKLARLLRRGAEARYKAQLARGNLPASASYTRVL